MTESIIIRAERKARAIDLLGGRCKKCGALDRLEFDHIKRDRTTKRELISQLYNCSYDKLLTELGRCQLLCKPCHVAKSVKERGKAYRAKHGTFSKYVNNGCRCVLCRGANAQHSRAYKKIKVNV